MTSTKPMAGLLAVLASVMLAVWGVGPGACQAPRSRAVDLKIRGGNDHWWQVTESGDGFVAEKHVPNGEPVERSNFKLGIDQMKVSGKYMAYDLSGKNKDVLAENRDTAENSRWKLDGSRAGMR